MKNLLGLKTLTSVGFGVAATGTYIVRQLRKQDFTDKVVLIMGGSRGLALEMSRLLVKQGAVLALAARDAEELERARSILDDSDKVHTFVCDVTIQNDVYETVSAVEKQLGPIDVLINNAGVIEVGPMEVQTMEDYEKAMKTHFWGPLYACEAVVQSMKERRTGRIVNICSIGGLVSIPHLLPYCASKHALVGLSEGLRAELLKDNIYVTTVCPGLMRTGSHVNAVMKGQNKLEYALFTAMDSLPFTSISAKEAAKQILKACKHGDANLVISPQAQTVQLAHALSPGLVSDLLGLTNFILPKEGGIGTSHAVGKDSESNLAPAPWTVLGDEASVRNNEVG